MLDKKKALNYVKEYIKDADNPGGIKKGYWRPDAKNRFEHTKRVCRHAKTLCHFLEEIDPEIVETAAIFHDVASFAQEENHAQAGAVIAKEYLEKEGMPKDFIEKVCQAIANHSKKIISSEEVEQLSIEDKVLIDANLIDETGIMRAIWVAMQEGRNELCYQRCLNKIKESADNINRLIKAAHTQKAKEILLRNMMLIKGISHTLESEIKGENF